MQGSPRGRKRPIKPAISLASRLRNRWHIERGQLQLLRACRRHQQIALVPLPPEHGGGKPNHYYHFVFDLLLPLSRLLQRAPATTHFAVGGLGPFSSQLERLFPGRVLAFADNRMMKRPPPGYHLHPLTGMNPRCCLVRHRELLVLRDQLAGILGAARPGVTNRVLLIERAAPDQYYSGRGQSSSGAERRSIRNHAEVQREIAGLFPQPGQFHNLQLETLSLRQQVEYFSSAQLVIAQHGAALANSLWLPAHAQVVELNSDPAFDHFSRLCNILRLRHHRYSTTGEHVQIEPEHLVQWLQSQVIEKTAN